MIDTLLQIIAPHYCYGCGEIGRVLCGNCKYNIIDDRFEGCIVCLRAVGPVGVCGNCRTSYTRGWVVSERTDTTERLIDAYKFRHHKGAAPALADLLHEVVPDLSLVESVVVVPVPTIATHIRRRGYDHIDLVARRFARLRGLPYARALRRQTNTVQVGSSRLQRIENAQQAFRVHRELDPRAIYLLIDDVVTTGATLQYAAKALTDAGAGEVWVAALARQTLDKPA